MESSVLIKLQSDLETATTAALQAELALDDFDTAHGPNLSLQEQEERDQLLMMLDETKIREENLTAMILNNRETSIRQVVREHRIEPQNPDRVRTSIEGKLGLRERRPIITFNKK